MSLTKRWSGLADYFTFVVADFVLHDLVYTSDEVGIVCVPLGCHHHHQRSDRLFHLCCCEIVLFGLVFVSLDVAAAAFAAAADDDDDICVDLSLSRPVSFSFFLFVLFTVRVMLIPRCFVFRLCNHLRTHIWLACVLRTVSCRGCALRSC